MRDSNYCGKQYTITASEMSKRRTKMMIQYVYVVCLISSLDLIAQCQCFQSANNQTSEKPNYDVEKQARKLPDDVEPITTYTNLLGDPNQIIGDGMTNAFQYYNDQIEITTPKYDSPPSIELLSNHQPIHQLDVNQSYFPQIEPVPYIPSETFINPPPPIPNTYLKKVTREPVWAHHLAPEVYKLENQYISTFRSIKSSVMGLYYKMQNFLGYVMSLFTIGKFPGYLEITLYTTIAQCDRCHLKHYLQLLTFIKSFLCLKKTCILMH